MENTNTKIKQALEKNYKYHEGIGYLKAIKDIIDCQIISYPDKAELYFYLNQKANAEYIDTVEKSVTGD